MAAAQWTPVNPTAQIDESKWIPVNSSQAVAPSAMQQIEYGLNPEHWLVGTQKGGVENLVPSVIAGAATGGKNIYNLASKLTGGVIPPVNQNYYQTMGVPTDAKGNPNGFLNNLAGTATQYAPAMLNPIGDAAYFTPSAVSGIGSRALNFGKNILNDAIPRAMRIGQQAAVGGALSQHPIQGAKDFATTQGIIEGANPLLRMALSPFHGMANLANPINKAKAFGEGLRNVVGKVKGQVKKMYAPMHRLGDQLLTDDPESLIDPENKKLFPLRIRRKLNTFLSNPTILNAHELQSDMFTVGNKIDPLTYGDSDIKNALEDSREPILNAISAKLNALEPAAGSAYDQGRYIHRNILQKLIPTAFFDNVAHGEIDVEDPNEIIKQYKKAFPLKSDVPDNYLTNSVNNLSDRIGLGKALQYAVPMIGGAVLSHSAGNGLIGDALGAGGGAMFARFEESPIIKNMLQNPGLHNALGKLGKIGRKVSRFAVPIIAGESSNSSNSLNSLPKSNKH